MCGLSGKPLILPGELEESCRKERERDGIPMPETLVKEFLEMAERYGVPLEI